MQKIDAEESGGRPKMHKHPRHWYNHASLKLPDFNKDEKRWKSGHPTSLFSPLFENGSKQTETVGTQQVGHRGTNVLVTFQKRKVGTVFLRAARVSGHLVTFLTFLFNSLIENFRTCIVFTYLRV